MVVLKRKKNVFFNNYGADALQCFCNICWENDSGSYFQRLDMLSWGHLCRNTTPLPRFLSFLEVVQEALRSLLQVKRGSSRVYIAEATLKTKWQLPWVEGENNKRLYKGNVRIFLSRNIQCFLNLVCLNDSEIFAFTIALDNV